MVVSPPVKWPPRSVQWDRFRSSKPDRSDLLISAGNTVCCCCWGYGQRLALSIMSTARTGAAAVVSGPRLRVRWPNACAGAASPPRTTATEHPRATELSAAQLSELETGAYHAVGIRRGAWL